MYDGNCKPSWPTRFSSNIQNPTKWEWFRTVWPFTSDDNKESFAYTAVKSDCIFSYKWIIAQLPKERLRRILSDIRGNVDFLIALYEYYPEFDCWPDGARWKTHNQIEFLALNGDKIKLGKDFLPKWPDDIKFLRQNANKFEWGPQKGTYVRDYFARYWSEENLQHWQLSH